MRDLLPVTLAHFTQLSGDAHGRAAFLLISVDVLTELGIHKRLFADLPIFLTAFDPQKIFDETVPQKLFADIVVIGQTPVCRRFLAREQKFLECIVGHAEIEEPCDIGLFIPIDHKPDRIA